MAIDFPGHSPLSCLYSRGVKVTGLSLFWEKPPNLKTMEEEKNKNRAEVAFGGLSSQERILEP